MRKAVIGLVAFCGTAAAAPDMPADEGTRELRVCAAADNLPLSNDRLEGFENRIAALIADQLHATVRYTWSEPRAGFVRRTLAAHRCDVVIGVPSGLPGVATTRPYYTSSYIFVSARKRGIAPSGFGDPVLKELRIGLEALGFEGVNPPPARAVARHGLASNVVGFSRMDLDDADNPSARIVAAVAAGEVDVGVVWGPVGAYFARAFGEQLQLTPVSFDPDLPALPFTYSISLGVRAGDDRFRDELQSVLDLRRGDIQAILEQYAVPLTRTPADDGTTGSQGASAKLHFQSN